MYIYFKICFCNILQITIQSGNTAAVQTQQSKPQNPWPSKALTIFRLLPTAPKIGSPEKEKDGQSWERATEQNPEFLPQHHPWNLTGLLSIINFIHTLLHIYRYMVLVFVLILVLDLEGLCVDWYHVGLCCVVLCCDCVD